VPCIFDDACMRDLARQLPKGADILKLAESVRAAACCYVDEVPSLSGDEVRAEIKKFREAASFKRPTTNRTSGVKYEKVARLRERLSRESLGLLTDRVARINRPPERTADPVRVMGRNGETLTRKGSLAFDIALPTADQLRDSKRRDEACETIMMLCSLGDRDLYAPRTIYGDDRGDGGAPIRRRRPKRKAELEFVGKLRVAWLVATGTRASRTASWHQPGPFVRFVTRCLQLVGAYDVPSAGEADHAAIAAAKLINEWERRGREVRKRRLLNLIDKWYCRRRRDLSPIKNTFFMG
jgi:hypothetical protein